MMFNIRTYLLALSTLLICAFAQQITASSSVPNVTNSSATSTSLPVATATSINKYLFHCSKEERIIEGQAWSDHWRVIQTARKWTTEGLWQPAMDTYMGTDSVQVLWSPLIKAALQYQYSMHTSEQWQRDSSLIIYCNERKYDKTTGSPYDGKVHCDEQRDAYAFLAARDLGHNRWRQDWNIVFCPRFWRERQSLDTIVKSMEDGTQVSNPVNLINSYAQTYFSMLMYVTASSPWDKFQLETPRACNALAKFAGCAGNLYNDTIKGEILVSSIMNMDNSLATFASVAFFQERMKTVLPSVPWPDKTNLSFTEIFTADSVPEHADKTYNYLQWLDLNIHPNNSSLPYDPLGSWIYQIGEDERPIYPSDYTGTDIVAGSLPNPNTSIVGTGSMSTASSAATSTIFPPALPPNK